MPAPKAAIPALVLGLRDSDSRVRRQAADALARFGPEAGKEGTDGLAEALADQVPDVRFRAARALSRIEGRGREPVVQVLLALAASPVATRPASVVSSATPLSDTRPPDRFDVVEVIRRLGNETESHAVSALIPLTVAEDPSVRREAAECLGLFGPRARSAVPGLERALGDDDPVVRCLSALSLSEIEGWEKGRARTLLNELVDSPSLPPGSRQRVRWVVQSDLVGGSEFSQPVHTLRALVFEYRQTEKMAALGLSPRSGADTPNPE
jgi:HEAT repeat protein